MYTVIFFSYIAIKTYVLGSLEAIWQGKNE